MWKRRTNGMFLVGFPLATNPMLIVQELHPFGWQFMGIDVLFGDFRMFLFVSNWVPSVESHQKRVPKQTTLPPPLAARLQKLRFPAANGG